MRPFCGARVAIQNADDTAFSGEGPGNAFADTRAAAGDNRDAILEVEIHVDRVAPLFNPLLPPNQAGLAALLSTAMSRLFDFAMA